MKEEKSLLNKILDGISNCYKMIFSLDSRLDKIDRNQEEIHKLLIQLLKKYKDIQELEKNIFNTNIRLPEKGK